MPGGSITLPSDPHLWRWMAFVDGENFTIRAQEIASQKGLQLTEGPHYRRDVFVWMPEVSPTAFIGGRGSNLRHRAVRSYYYTSTTGAEDEQKRVRQALWELGFDPTVFKKNKQTSKTKGVDVTLTKDVLSHAFLNNYDTAVLVAGDGDYVPLVTELKRLGKVVYVYFFVSSGMSPELRLASDTFFPMDATFLARWKAPALLTTEDLERMTKEL
jgi:hypothetical protein